MLSGNVGYWWTSLRLFYVKYSFLSGFDIRPLMLAYMHNIY